MRKYKVGDKVKLNLHTKYGSHGIREDRHNVVCTVHREWHPHYTIRDDRYTWGVPFEMLKPVEQQLLFSFMYK